MKFGSNYASLRIPYGDPLKVVQFRFGEYITEDETEIEMLKNHPDTFVIGGDADGAGNGDGEPKTQPNRKSGNTRKRADSSGDGQ